MILTRTGPLAPMPLEVRWPNPGARLGREPQRGPAPITPFARGSLASLRLLAGFVLVSDEARAGRRALLRLAGADGAPACTALPTLLVATRRQPRVAWTLDGILAGFVGDRVDRLEHRSVAALAESWRTEAASLAGLDLLALLWWLARDPRVAVRPLERKIAADIDPSRLLSRAQRAELYGESDPIREEK